MAPSPASVVHWTMNNDHSVCQWSRRNVSSPKPLRPLCGTLGSDAAHLGGRRQADQANSQVAWTTSTRIFQTQRTTAPWCIRSSVSNRGNCPARRPRRPSERALRAARRFEERPASRPRKLATERPSPLCRSVRSARVAPPPPIAAAQIGRIFLRPIPSLVWPGTEPRHRPLTPVV